MFKALGHFFFFLITKCSFTPCISILIFVNKNWERVQCMFNKKHKVKYHHSNKKKNFKNPIFNVLGFLLMDFLGIVWGGRESAIWDIFTATSVFSHERLTDQIFTLASKNSKYNSAFQRMSSVSTIQPITASQQTASYPQFKNGDGPNNQNSLLSSYVTLNPQIF